MNGIIGCSILKMPESSSIRTESAAFLAGSFSPFIRILASSMYQSQYLDQKNSYKSLAATSISYVSSAFVTSRTVILYSLSIHLSASSIGQTDIMKSFSHLTPDAFISMKRLAFHILLAKFLALTNESSENK